MKIESAGLSENGNVEVSVGRGVARVVLNRPTRKNSLTRFMLLRVVDIMKKLDRDHDVQVITISGAGGDFSAGASLGDLDDVLFDGAGSKETHVGTDLFSKADAAIRSTRKPTISLVEGICMGGGWQLAAAADVILASTSARIAITPAKLGILYPRPGLERLVERVGRDRAKYLLMTGNEVTPEKAECWGLVTRAVSAEDFLSECEELVGVIMRRSRFSIEASNSLIDAYLDLSDRGDYEEMWKSFWAQFRSGEDFAEGKRAFAAREVPNFSWTSPHESL